jgi:hypothetical protein
MKLEMLSPELARVAAEPYYQPVGDEVALFEAAYRRRLPALLKGPTGCGKTRFVEYMAWKLQRPLVTVACHDDLTTVDLVGRYLIVGEQTVWMDGPLTAAVRAGAICYLDEIVEARKDTTVVIHPLTDSRRVLAVDNVPSRADGNDTLLIINRIGGNLGTGAATLSTLFGLLYDDAENALSFSVTGGCQLRNSLSNTFPRTAPRLETFIPAGRSGWMKLYSQSDIGILGSVINLNTNAGASAGAFNGGHNLHHLTLSAAANYVLPIFPPSC